MDDTEWLTERFQSQRSRLRAVAYRILGSTGEAEDAVQEAWLRLHRADTSAVQNLDGWLTTVVARVCLDMLRSRAARREEPVDSPASGVLDEQAPDPEREALLGETVGLALLAVLDTLAPAERVAFVLHDLFEVPFAEIGPIVGRSPDAARQLASRGRRRVKGASAEPDSVRQRQVVEAFLAASRGGDFAALLEVLDPDVELRADAAAIRMGAATEVYGAHAVAETFAGRARAARLALLDGSVGLLWTMGGQPKVAFAITVADGRITGVEMVADEARLGQLDWEFL